MIAMSYFDSQSFERAPGLARYVMVTSVMATMFIFVGCYNDVPYSAGVVANADSGEEPDADPEESATGSLDEVTVNPDREESLADIWDLDDDELKKLAKKSSQEGEPEPEAEVSSNPWHVSSDDKSGSAGEKKPAKEIGLPWQKKGEDTVLPAEAAKFFGGLTDQKPAAEQPTRKRLEPEPTRRAQRPSVNVGKETAMGSFLEEAYSDLPVATTDSTADKEADDEDGSRTAADRNRRVAANQLWPSNRKKSNTTAQTKRPGALEIDIPLAIQGVPKKKKPKESKPRYAEEDLSVPIWEEEIERPAKPKVAQAQPKVEPAPAKPASDPNDIDNWDKPIEVASRTPTPLPLPKKEATPQIEPIIPEPQQPPMLPSVAVRRDNTRHLAWLLGGKLGLARLAVAEGSTDDEARAWIAESRRLAEQLGVDPSDFGLDAPPTLGGAPERVLALLETAHKASEAVARAHGNDHAALLEASLKANTMLVLYKDRPDLVVPIARAVRSASERAGLREDLWRNPLTDLELSNSDQEVYNAVTSLFASVENDLR